MPYFYLISSLFLITATSICGGLYSRKNAGRTDPSPLYNLTYCFTSLVCWAVMFAADLSFDPLVLLYSCGFGLCYALCQIGFIRALRSGPMSLTSLLLQLALIGTTVWGFIFWGAELTPLVVIGLVLVVISLWLCLYTKSENGKERISLKWLLCALLAFAGNAGCSIIQRTQQMHFDGKYGNQLMAFAMIFSVAFTLVTYLRSNKTESREILKRTALFPILAGASNFLLNLFIILLASTTLSPGIIYPVVAVGGIALISLFSLVVFRERLRPSQWVGIGIGALAVALLSL